MTASRKLHLSPGGNRLKWNSYCFYRNSVYRRENGLSSRNLAHQLTERGHNLREQRSVLFRAIDNAVGSHSAPAATSMRQRAVTGVGRLE